MDRFEREEYIRQILDIEYDDDESYTRAELEALSDDDLKECHSSETAPVAEVPLEPETCIICKEFKICELDDADGRGPVCQACGNAVEMDGDDDDDDDDDDVIGDDEDDDDEDEFEEGEAE